MKLAQIQPYVAQLIGAHPEISGIVPVLMDDGAYPQTPLLESALKTKGIAIVVWSVGAQGTENDGEAGTALFPVYVPVMVERNAKVCAATSGARISAERTVECIIEACIGKPKNQTTRLRLGAPPFENFGTASGLQRFAVHMELDHTVTGI